MSIWSSIFRTVVTFDRNIKDVKYFLYENVFKILLKFLQFDFLDLNFDFDDSHQSASFSCAGSQTSIWVSLSTDSQNEIGPQNHEDHAHIGILDGKPFWVGIYNQERMKNNNLY